MHFREDYKRVLKQLETQPYKRLLAFLRKRSPKSWEFRTWAEVVEFMRAPRSQGKDPILRDLIAEHQLGDSQASPVLLAFFYPSLVSLFKKKQWWRSDADLLWSDITWCFLESISKVNLEKRDVRLHSKIFMDTFHKVYLLCKKAWESPEVCESDLGSDDSGQPLRLEVSVSDAEMESYFQQNENQVMEEELQERLRSGLISEPEYFLLLGTEIYGHPLKDVAIQSGLNYEAAKKKRQRAKLRLKKHASRKRNLSPSSDSAHLSLVELRKGVV